MINSRSGSRHYAARKYPAPKPVPRTKRLPKPRPAPKLTQDEKEGAELLTRVWVRIQAVSRERDKARSKKKYFEGDILWDSMFLVSKVRGRLRRGYYR
jgi:hypothetical protein